MASKDTNTFNNNRSIIKNNILSGEEDPIDDRNIGELILNAFKSRPDFIGQVDARTGEENTFQQMRERSIKCALWLKKLGVQRDDAIIVYTHNHLDTYIPYLAILYIGAILSVWHQNRPINLRYFILHTSPKVIFTDSDKAPTIFKVVQIMDISTKIVVFKKDKEESIDVNKFVSIESILNDAFDKTEIDEFSCVKLKSNRDTAVIMFSCGVIGLLPLNLEIPHAFLTAPASHEVPVMAPDDVGLWIESLDWNISLLLTLRAILSYVKAIKFHGSLNTDDEVSLFCNVIKKYKITWIFLKSAMCLRFDVSQFDVLKNYNMPSLKQVLLGGDPIPYALYKMFTNAFPNAFVIQVYCLPETGVIGYQRETKNPAFRVSKNVRLLFFDVTAQTDVRAKPYTLGMLWCKSPSIFNSYFVSMKSRDIVTADAADRNGWFPTEDVCYYTPNGDIYNLDRSGTVIKYNGHYFIPKYLELLILSHPEVSNVVVTSIWFNNDHTLALVIKKEESKVTKTELIQFVAQITPCDCMHLRAGVLFVKTFFIRNGYFNRRAMYRMANNYFKKKEYNEFDNEVIDLGLFY